MPRKSSPVLSCFLPVVCGVPVVVLVRYLADFIWTPQPGDLLQVKPALSEFLLAAAPISWGLSQWMIWFIGRRRQGLYDPAISPGRTAAVSTLLLTATISGLFFTQIIRVGRTVFTQEGIVFTPWNGIRTVHHGYGDIVSMIESRWVEGGPRGITSDEQDVTLHFGDGTRWSNQLGNDSASESHQAIVQLIESKTDVRLQIRKGRPERN